MKYSSSIKFFPFLCYDDFLPIIHIIIRLSAICVMTRSERPVIIIIAHEEGRQLVFPAFKPQKVFSSHYFIITIHLTDSGRYG